VSTSVKVHPVDAAAARRFLEGRRIAVVGASDEKGNFGATIAKALRDHGTDVVLVHPSARPVDAMASYVDISAVPGDLDGAILVVPPSASLGVVEACVAKGVPAVWFFRGLGAPGSRSPEALAAAEAAGLEVIAGACPLMFLEPVTWFHRVHRRARRARHAVVG
jgi:acyl-CoA synthetase (NDP forming)